MVAATLALAVPTAALACRCVPPTPAVAYKRAASVVLARVETVIEAGPLYRGFRLVVTESWKQRQPTHIVVRTSLSNCAQEVETGKAYLLYLEATKDGFYTAHCMGNLSAEEAGPVLRTLRGVH